jgi:tetratricopeptide (TPR) repeat protein
MLCGFFFLWALVLYLYYRKSNFLRYYYLALFSFVLSLLSKPMGLALPFVLLAVEYLKNYRLKYWDKVPFLFLSVGILMFNVIFNGFSVNSEWKSLKSFLLVPYQINFYLGKVLIPLKLSCLYPPPIKTGALWPPSVLFSPILLFFLAAAVLFSLRYTRKIVFGSLFFLLLLSPVLFSHAYGTYVVADHFTYLTLIGIFFMFAEGFFWLYRQKIASLPVIRISLLLIPFLVIGILSYLTWERCEVWKDSVTLWSDVLKNCPNAKTAYKNRGSANALEGNFKQAIFDFNRAIYLDPGDSTLYVNLGNAYASNDNFARAFYSYNEALKIDPKNGEAYYNRAVAYLLKKEYNNAWQDVYNAEKLGWEVNPGFLEELKKVSGRKK